MCVEEISELVVTGDLVAIIESTRVSRRDAMCGNACDKGTCARPHALERRTNDVCTTNDGVCEWARVGTVPGATVFLTVLWDSGSLFLIITKEPEYGGADRIRIAIYNPDPILLKHRSRTKYARAVPNGCRKWTLIAGHASFLNSISSHNF